MAKRMEKVLFKGFPWLVAIEDETIIGYATPWNNRLAYKHSAEVTVQLTEANTSKGWGTALYRVLFHALQNIAVHRVIGDIALQNEASVELHKKMGIKKVD